MDAATSFETSATNHTFKRRKITKIISTAFNVNIHNKFMKICCLDENKEAGT
jgi:hypothetical protein